MRLRFKVLAGFFILSLMLLVAGAWAVYQMSSLGVSVQKVLDENYKSIHAGKNLLEALEREDSGFLLLLLGNWDEGRTTINGADTAFQESLEAAEKNITIPGEEKLLKEIGATYAAYKEFWVRPIVGTKKERDLEWYSRDVHAAFLEAKARVNDLITLNDQEMYKTASELKDRANRATMPGLVAMVSAFLFSLLFSYLFNVFVVNPLIRITEAIHAFMQTGKPYDVEVKTGDEIAHLSDAIRNLSLMARVADK